MKAAALTLRRSWISDIKRIYWTITSLVRGLPLPLLLPRFPFSIQRLCQCMMVLREGVVFCILVFSQCCVVVTDPVRIYFATVRDFFSQ